MYMKRAFFVSILILSVLAIDAQDWNAVFNHEMDAEYFIAEGNFDRAAESYIKALGIVPNSNNLKFKVGYCFLKTDTQRSRALTYLSESAQNVSKEYDSRSFRELKAPPEAMYNLGVAYMHENLFDAAIDCFNRYKEFCDANDTYVVALISQRINDCNRAKQTFAGEHDYLLNLKPLGINNENSNFNAVFSGDGNTLAYTSRTDLGNEIFVSSNTNGTWAAPVNISRRLGSKILRTAFLSFEGTTLYLVEEDFNGSRLVMSTFAKNKWSKVSDLPKPISSKYNEGHICTTKDGQTAYFSSDRKGGLGGMDIYRVVRVNNKWGKAENLGDKINTVLDEKTPFLTDDERYLFFSSDGHEGIGGQDIYYVDLQDPASKVINLGAPLNTADDDVFYCPKSLTEGYYASVQAGGAGLVDVYSVEIQPLYGVNFNIQLASQDLSTKSYAVSVVDRSNGNVIKEMQGRGANQLKLRLPAGNYSAAATGAEVEQAYAELQIPQNANRQEFNKTILINKVHESVVEPVAEVVEPISREVKVEEKEQPKVSEVVKEKLEPTKVEIKAEQKSKPKPKQKVQPKPTRLAAKIELSFDDAEPERVTYSVQVFASEQPADIQYITPFDSVDVTISPSGYYRYSIGKTTSVDMVEAWLKLVKSKGYENAYARINREHAGYTIQVMALSKPKHLAYFDNIPGVMVSRAATGMYRYYVGKYSSKSDAQADLENLHQMGYEGAFVREL